MARDLARGHGVWSDLPHQEQRPGRLDGDARAVVAACGRRHQRDNAALRLVVPAYAGLLFDAASVGDPDPLATICDALADLPADELLLCTRAPRVTIAHPFDLAHRARRLTGLAVSRVQVPAASTAQSAPRRLRFGRGTACSTSPSQPKRR